MTRANIQNDKCLKFNSKKVKQTQTENLKYIHILSRCI